jgi:hypothetical protein
MADTNYNAMPKIELFEKTVHSLFGIYLDNPSLQKLKKKSGTSIFKSQWMHKKEMHILIFKDFFRCGGAELSPVKKMHLFETTGIKKSSCKKYREEEFLRLSFKGLANSNKQIERYSKLTPLTDDDDDQVKMLFCAYNSSSEQVDRYVLLHDLHIRFKGDINPFSDNKTASNENHQRVFFIFRLHVPKNSLIPISWEISPLTSEDGSSLDADVFYQFNSHRDEDLDRLENIFNSLVKTMDSHPYTMPYKMKELTDENRLMKQNGINSDEAIKLKFDSLPSEERDLRCVASLLRKMHRIKGMHTDIKSFFELLTQEINSIFIFSNSKHDSSDLDFGLFEDVENHRKMACILSTMNRLDLDFVSSWIRSRMYFFKDHFFTEYLKASILNFEMIDDLEDKTFEADDRVQLLTSQLNEFKKKMHLQVKSIFDHEGYSWQKFLSIFALWKAKNKRYACLNNV